ncbi:MAG: F0F1 ATP synthase subunit epsilon [Candidatus Dasytiphilus stammeri]
MITKCELVVVSPEQKIFCGSIQKLVVTGSEGLLGIYPGHMPLLTSLKPGMIQIYCNNDARTQEIVYISGGILEVYPKIITVLADTAIPGNELDESRALAAKAEAEQDLETNPTHQRNLNNLIAVRLAKEIAKLRVIEFLRRKK